MGYPGYGAEERKRLSAGATRELTVPVSTARTALLQAIRRLEFATTLEQFSVIEAERGSAVKGLILSKTRVPTALRIDIDPAGDGCVVQIRVEDRWRTPGRAAGTVTVYADVFTDVLTEIDASLKRIDEDAAASFPLWWRDVPEHQVLARDPSAAARPGRLESAWRKGSSRLLDGPKSGPNSATAEAGLHEITFVTPDSVAVFDADTVDGMLVAGQLVAAKPGDMPKNLVEQVQQLVVRLEDRLDQISAAGSGGHLVVELDKADIPVVTFLYQQAALRETLPVRLLMSCTTCRLEKVVNPDLARMRERSRRVKVLSSSVGAVFGSHTISPFILVGRMAQIKKTEPDFVCSRCQGIDADETPITFCPRCGDRRSESSLRICGHCKLDLRKSIQTKAVWREITAPPAPPTSVGVRLPVLPLPGTPEYEALAADDSTTAVSAWPPPSENGTAELPTPAWSPPAEWSAPTAWSAPAASSPAASPGPPAWTPTPSSPAQVAAASQPAGWYPDPWRRYENRYWDGTTWTSHVGLNGAIYVDQG